MSNYTFKALCEVTLSPLVQKTWVFTSIIIFFLITILFLPWEQTVKGYGKIVAFDPSQRDYNILSTMDGFIKEFNVKENQFVKKGTTLFTIRDIDKAYRTRLENIITNSQTKYQNILIQQSNVQKRKENIEELIDVGKALYKEKLLQIKQKIARLKFNKIALKKHNAIEVTNLKRSVTLYQEGIESKRALDKNENLVIQTDTSIKKLEIDMEIEKRNLAIIKQEEATFLKTNENTINNLENSKIALKNQLASLSQTLEQQKSSLERYKKGIVVAQKDGYILRILENDKDKYIKKGEAIIHFAPKVDTKSIFVKMSDFNMPLVKKGLPARIRFYGWPSLYVSGWPAIRYGTFGGTVKKVEAISHEEGFYYAHILETKKEEPWPNHTLLRVGTRATVWIRLHSVPIWYQLWRLMNAIPPKMKTPIITKEYE